MAKRKGARSEGQDAAANRAGDRRDARPPVDPEHLRRSDGADAFIGDPDEGPSRSDDDLAEALGEQFVQSATSAGDVTDEALEQVVSEEIGGPFIESSPEEEFADGTDASNPPDATAEPLPRAVSGLAQRPRRE
jgi:hypothetical protein